MKLLHNIRIFVILAFMTVGASSCSEDGQEIGDAQVNFTATIPTDCTTRTFGDAQHVNTLVVGIFRKNVTNEHASCGDGVKYHEIGRKLYPVNGTTVDIQCSLVQNQTYSFVFWAYDSDMSVYDIDNLTMIKMNAMPETLTFAQAEAADAFFAVMEDITINGDKSYSVELVRPLAQFNVGTTGGAMQASFTAKAAPDTFYPFTNTVSGTSDFTWNLTKTTTETFSVDDEDYNYLAMGYLFAPVTAVKIAAELTVTKNGASKTMEIPQVEIQANRRSNIVGRITLE